MVVDVVHHKAMRQGQTIDLTKTEFLLLDMLAQNSPCVVSRSALIQGIWGSPSEVTSGALDVLVNALRAKLDARFSNKLLHTVRGSGYLLDAEFKLYAGASGRQAS